MLIKQLHQSLIPVAGKLNKSQVAFWLSLCLICAFIYAWMGQEPAFSSPYAAQDDARQHVFWMRRFLDPELFPNDWIADYFQSLAPAGYTAVYRLAAMVGIDPLFFNKLLPFGLALIATIYGFGACLQILPVPFAGFLTALLLNQNLWLHDDIPSGTARAFLYPIFLAFLYYLLRRSLLPCLVTIALQGLFYPQFIFIMSGVLCLRLLTWQGGLRLSHDRRDYLFCGTGLIVAFLVLLPYALEVSQYGPQITLEEAKVLPEFAEGGRTDFFNDNPRKFWLTAKRSGAVVWIMPLCILSVVVFPILLKFSHRFPLITRLQNLGIFAQVGLVSVGMFLAAHALLFKLYLPSRYTHANLQILSALITGITIPILLDTIFGWAQQRQVNLRQWGAIATVIFLGAILFHSPKLYEFPKKSYIVGGVPKIYRFFAEQPKDILIASLSREIDNIPSFSQRSILVAREYALPYHQGYYRQIRQRIIDLIRAHYSPNLAEVQAFIRNYGIDYWLIDRNYLQKTEVKLYRLIPMNNWLNQFQPLINQIRTRLEQGEVPILVNLSRQCSVLRVQNLEVLDAECILRLPQEKQLKVGQKETPSPSVPP
jgi:hypothetical protein